MLLIHFYHHRLIRIKLELPETSAVRSHLWHSAVVCNYLAICPPISMFVYSRKVLCGRRLSDLRLWSVKRTRVGKLWRREWTYRFVCYRLYLFLHSHMNFHFRTYIGSYFRSQYIFYVLPVIYYESDIQTEINITFLKVSDSFWHLYRAADLLSTLHLPPFSICFNTDIVFHQRAATICSGILVLSSIAWIHDKDRVLILKGKIRICQMSVYKVDLLSVAHWVVP